MIVSSSLAFVCSLLLHLQQTDGFATVQMPSLGRSKNMELSSSFYRVSLSSSKALVDGRSVIVNRNRLALRATEEEGEVSEGEGSEGEVDKTEAVDDSKKLAGRKKRLVMGYKLAYIAYMASSAWSLYKLSGMNVPYGLGLNFVFGGGPFTMAVILYILKGAAGTDRLSNKTNMRLNIAVISYALVQLVIPIKTLSWRTSLKVPAFLALINGIKGYGYGCLGWDKSKGTCTILTDAKEGIQSTLKGLTVVKAKSAGYLFGTLLLGSMSCLKLKEICSILFFSSAETTTYLSAFKCFGQFSRYGLMTTIMYTLKDASDRDRLSGNTFIKLNLLAAASFLSTVLYLLPDFGKLSVNAQILVAGGLSAMTAFKGLFRHLSKDSYL